MPTSTLMMFFVVVEFPWALVIVFVIAQYHLILPFFLDVQYTKGIDRYGIF